MMECECYNAKAAAILLNKVNGMEKIAILCTDCNKIWTLKDESSNILQSKY